VETDADRDGPARELGDVKERACSGATPEPEDGEPRVALERADLQASGVVPERTRCSRIGRGPAPAGPVRALGVVPAREAPEVALEGV
jgi:hypothetical protein